MGAVDVPASFEQLGGTNLADAKLVNSKAAGNNVHDGINRSDLVKAHIFNRNSVDLSFGNRNPAKNSNRSFDNGCRQIR